MSNFKRILIPGGTFFFTLVTYQRMPVFADEYAVGVLGDAFRKIKNERPFYLDAVVILPEHLHCIMRLPRGDSDYSGRWREIKKLTSRELNRGLTAQTQHKIWQRRFWEHTIRDDKDWRQHMDYIHYNPVKHGLAASPRDWKWSSFHKMVSKNWYEPSWGSTLPDNISDMKLE